MLEKVQEWDERWSCRINGREFGTILNGIFVYFTHIGSVIPWIVACIILFMFKQDILAAILLSGIVQFGVINFIFKRIVTRKRPYRNERIKDQIELRDFMLRNGGSSFPSGHVTTFTMETLVLAYYFNNPYLLFVTLFGLLFVGYSRLYLGAHYPTDVFGGILFGIGMRFVVTLTFPITLWMLEQFYQIFSF